MTAHNITVESEFVPWSQSRSYSAEDVKYTDKRNLNWRVTLKHDGRDVLTTDYSAGIAHCPAYKSIRPGTLKFSLYNEELFEHETETGTTARRSGAFGVTKGKPILPEADSVLCSLVMDASVLDASTFEEWVGDLGYDEDSRAAEAIYRACLEIALKLRNGLGNDTLVELQEVFRDF